MSKEKREATVEAFTVKAYTNKYRVASPPNAGAFKERPYKPTKFRKYYESGELPIVMEHNSRGNSITWKVDLEELDYHRFLPLFFEGLAETKHPYEFFARLGTHELLDHGGPRILPLIPQLIMPIKNALNTRNHQVMCTTLKALQHLVLSADGVGEALVPYFRQILPVFNIFKNKNKNLGDGFDHSQRTKENIGNLITETLQMLEYYGGPNAYINIKYMIPTYQSCMLN